MPVRWSRPGLESVTVKLSSGSTVVSPLTLTAIVLLVSPAAKLTVPDGSVPTKSAAAPSRRDRVAHDDCRRCCRPGHREGERRGPRVALHLARLIGRNRERRRRGIVVKDGRVAVAVPMVAPGLDSVTLKLSSGSTMVSPLTLTVIVLLVSPAAKLTVPDGSVPPNRCVAVPPVTA